MIKRAPFGILLLMLSFQAGVFAKPAADFPEAPPQKKYFVGEKLTYEIYYLGLAVGESVSEVKEILNVRGHRAYHIEVKVRSYKAIDLIYKVRDEHHSYIDVETLASLGYEKKLREGWRHSYERTEFFPEDGKAFTFNEKKVLKAEAEIPLGTQDALSCGYFARTFEAQEKTSSFIPVYADNKNWNLEVRFHEKVSAKVKGVGNFKAVRAEPLMEFQGIFIRKGKVEGWVGLDARRLPLSMKVKIPVLGNISAELREYQPGQG